MVGQWLATLWVVLCVLTAARDQKSELFVYVYSTQLQQNLRTSPDFTCFFCCVFRVSVGKYLPHILRGVMTTWRLSVYIHTRPLTLCLISLHTRLYSHIRWEGNTLFAYGS